MAMANNRPTSNWRNFAAWVAVGAVFYLFVAWGGISLLSEDSLAAVFRSKPAAAILGLGLMFSAAAVAFARRKSLINPRSIRNFVIRDTVAVVVFVLFVWGFRTLARAGTLGAMGTSEWVAAVTGSVLVGIAVLGSLATASAHTRTDVLDDEVAAEDMRERSWLMFCSFAWMGACGLLLIGLSLSGPGGVLSPAVALAGALVLGAVLAVLGIAAWRLSDELGRTLSHETGNMAFYLIWVIGSGWAVLAHLGFVAAPALLDWVTLFTVLLFVATFIVLGRRKLLTR